MQRSSVYANTRPLEVHRKIKQPDIRKAGAWHAGTHSRLAHAFARTVVGEEGQSGGSTGESEHSVPFLELQPNSVWGVCGLEGTGHVLVCGTLAAAAGSNAMFWTAT